MEATLCWLPAASVVLEPVEKGSTGVTTQRMLVVASTGMHWSLATSDGLAALRTLVLNGGWERYWIEGEVLPLVEAQAA